MEQLKVKKKDALILNAVFFLVLSYFFLYLQYAYRHHLSPFSVTYLRKSFDLFWYVAIPILFSCVLLWRHQKSSLVFFNISLTLVGFKIAEGLFIEFNKIIVIALFVFIIISYSLYQLLNYYFSLARVNTNYSQNDMFEPLLVKIPCKVGEGDKSVEGYLTNWDDDGCFIKLERPAAVDSQTKIMVSFMGRDFIQAGEVVSEAFDLSGIGVKFLSIDKQLDTFNWNEFTILIEELGFQPQRLK